MGEQSLMIVTQGKPGVSAEKQAGFTRPWNLSGEIMPVRLTPYDGSGPVYPLYPHIAGTRPLIACDTIPDIAPRAASALAAPRSRATTSAYEEKETENRSGESQSLPPAGAVGLPAG